MQAVLVVISLTAIAALVAVSIVRLAAPRGHGHAAAATPDDAALDHVEDNNINNASSASPRRRGVHRRLGHAEWARTAQISRRSSLILLLEGGGGGAAPGGGSLPPSLNITLDPSRARHHWRYIRRAAFRARLASANRSSPTDRVCSPGTGDCEFYRSEAAPPPERPDGPPYGLFQGRMRGLLPTAAAELKHEADAGGGIRPGDVVRIQGADFFVALASHDSWAASFTVFGHLASATELKALQDFAGQAAFHTSTHSSGTNMRLLDHPVRFTLGGGS
jgi:hypothetical protein